MTERRVEVLTASGNMSAFLCRPDRGGPYPIIIVFMDAVGIREELRDMARRIADRGYYVMLPNLYYRSGEEELGSYLGEEGAPVRARMLELMDSLTIPMVKADTDALLAYADGDPCASKQTFGCVGYCMSGQYAINTAAHYSGRAAAAASIYGVRLVTDATSSPHLAGASSPHITAGRAKGELYFGWADIDEYAPQEWIKPIRQSMATSGVPGEIELYRGAEHGFAFPDRPSYNHEASEHHWKRLFELFARRLR
jgi:carboxymethylenebutenolidase